MLRRSVLGCVKAGEENAELLKFLAEESKKAEKPLTIKQLSSDFIEKSGSSRTNDAVRSKIYKLLSDIPKMENIDKETKVRMLVFLSYPVNEEYLNELLNDAVVVVDDKQRIITYESKDGSFKLEGKHNAGAKIQAGRENSRRRSGIPRDFQEENVEEENRQVYESTNEPMNVQNFGTNSRNNTIKRKINTQNSKSTKKSKKPSPTGEVEPEEEDVVYEGPEEPPRPIQLPRKREPVEEAMPETHFFGFFENSGNLKLEEDVDFEVSPEDAVDRFSTALSESSSMIVSQPSSSDSIKITTFLKPLRSLVETLESPKLCGLHQKIDGKIRELEDLKAQIKYILFSLQSVIVFVTKHATSSYLEEDSTSLKEFLLIFRAATFDFTAPEFADFQKTLREAIKQIGNEDKRVSYEEIQYGLEYAMKLVLP